MGVAAGAGGGAIGSPMGGLFGSLLGSQISSTPAGVTMTRNPVTGVMSRPGIGPTPAPAPAPAPAPMPAPSITPASQSGFNVNTAAAQALQQAIGGTRRAVGNTGLLTSMVTNQTLADLERQRQMQQNQLGMQASRAGAYGGSRHGVAEALTNEAFARQGAQTLGNLQLGQQQALMRGAAQLGQLGQQAFTTGRTIGQDLAAQGLLQQALQQQLIDAARGQYAGYIGAPMAATQAPLAALGVAPYPKSEVQSAQPGLFDYLTLAASTAARFCWVAREVYGEDDPKWLQFREWVIGYSPDWFFNAYGKYGEKLAAKIKRNPWMKKVIRPFMDLARKSLGYK